MLYSGSTGGFYSSEINGESIPPDAVDIADECYSELLAGQSSGQVIVSDETGHPILQNPPQPTEEQLILIAMKDRDQRLATAAIRIAPLQDAVDIGEATAAEEQQLLEWKKYRVALNRITEQPDFPTVIEWPDIPSI